MRKRKKAMIIIGSLLLVVILVFVFLDGTFLAKRYASVWSDKYINRLEDDQSRIIATAIRAASSHNTQPWLVKLVSGDTIELYADMSKALSVVDADNKQLLMSQGTFIESFRWGAVQYGYGADITYSKPDFSNNIPLIATIKVYKEEDMGTVDAVSSSTYAAVKPDENTSLKKTLNQCIAEYPGFSYAIIESDDDVVKLEEVLMEGTIIESKDEEAMKELLDVFRFTEWEKSEHRYGLSLNTLPAILKPFMQPIIKSVSKDWEGFGDSGIKQFKERLAQQTKYILIKCEDPGHLEYIYSGQIYQKLIFEVDEYDLRPAMQALENFDAMKNLNKQFQETYGRDGEVVWIIGLQDKTDPASNPRHLVDDIIVQ